MRKLSVRRLTGVARALILTLAASTVLAGCDFDVFQTKLAITVTNNTDEDLTVRQHGQDLALVDAGTTQDVLDLGPLSRCLNGGITATTGESVAPDWTAAPDALEATMPTPICNNDTWVIEDTDLVPITATDPTPTPSPSP